MLFTSKVAIPEAALQHACRHSRFLGRCIDSQAWLGECLAQSLDKRFDPELMESFLSKFNTDEAALAEGLRKLRTWVICHLIVRDLGGLADLAEVTATMTTLAEICIDHAHLAVRHGLQLRFGSPCSAAGHEQHLCIIGMGKLGGRELNVSSDIDLIFVYPEDGETNGNKMLSNFEFFERLGKGLVRMLTDSTEHGQVFRVDMRLRPNGDSGPLVCSHGMLGHYFITQGREWERYAWIKARALDSSQQQELEQIVRPFIFRKYLDFGVIEAMRRLHAQIRREVSLRDRRDNIKLGPGGIREIEFIAQVFQLIRGGRETSLQTRPTLAVLSQLGKLNMLDAQTVEELQAAYVFLRKLEHRLQYLDDAQTHDLPASESERHLIASAMGWENLDQFLTTLEAHRKQVSLHFETIFADPAESEHPLDALWQGADNIELNCQCLGELGYRNPKSMAEQLDALQHATCYQQLVSHIRERFDALVPRLIEAAAQERLSDETLSCCLDLLAAISRRGAYLALLQQYPCALQRVVELIGASPWVAQYLIQHPILLDELLDERQHETEPDWQRFGSDLASELALIEPDQERQMDLMRERHHAQVFSLLSLDLTGKLSVERLADHLSALADTMLEQTLPVVWQKIKQRHCEQAHFAVIAYGKLGGKELGYAADLDLVFLFDDPADEAMMVYSRFAQRINTWLSSQTGAGILFKTDLRLRPDGDSGLLVSSLQGFRKYQLESAWPWEHQALTRARFAAGDKALGTAFEAIRCEILQQPRQRLALRNDILLMRQKMRDAHSNKSELFDLKHDHGGLVDVEFLVQYLVLGYAHEHPQLCANLGNIALLRIAAEIGLIPKDLALQVGNNYRLYRHLQHRQRLAAQASRVAAEEIGAAQATTLQLWQRVFDHN